MRHYGRDVMVHLPVVHLIHSTPLYDRFWCGSQKKPEPKKEASHQTSIHQISDGNKLVRIHSSLPRVVDTPCKGIELSRL